MINLWLKIVNFLFPVTCVVCGNDLPYDDYYRICDECAGKIKLIDGHYCKKCGLDLPDGGEHCYSCVKKPNYYFENIRAACVYKDVAKNLIHKLKYSEREYINRIIGRMMERTAVAVAAETNVDYIVFVPMHKLKEYLRGYNQAELIARKISEVINKPILKGLRRGRITKAQYRLKKDERQENVAGCFKLKENMKYVVKGKNLLLIDDVCTTCATMNECSKVLRRAGAAKVYGLAFARD